MKASEAVELVAECVERWPASELNPDQLRRLTEEIGPLERDMAAAAIKALAADGRDFCPTGGAIRRRAVLLVLDPPTWERVVADVPEWRRVQATLPPWVCPEGTCSGDGKLVDEEARTSRRCSCWDQRVARRWEGLHPMAAEALTRGSLSLSMLERAARGDTTVAAQLRDCWQEFVADVVESRLLAMIDGPPVARLTRARQDDHLRLTAGTARGALDSGAAGRYVKQLSAGEAA